MPDIPDAPQSTGGTTTTAQDFNSMQRWSNKKAQPGSGGGDSRFKKPEQSAGKALGDWARIEGENAGRIGESIQPVKYHRGGKVRKTGPAVLKRGERVIPAGKRKKVERLMKRNKMKMRSSGR